MTIASYTYRNGRWGDNTAWIARKKDGSYLVSAGYDDPWYHRTAFAAKAHFRDIMASHP